jgi:uncharacterized protein YecA (UPF0149 family)
MNLANNTRRSSNRGFTPNELMALKPPADRIPRAMHIGPNMSEALRHGEMDINEMRRKIMTMNMPNGDLRISMLKELNRIQNEAKQQPDAVKKVGRNDPCPCGSGKKYKHCCGR